MALHCSYIFEGISAFTGVRPYQGLMGDADVSRIDMAYRVISDHVRTLTFALADGAVPSNEGRGYVLRRILRRAVRYGRQFLQAKPGIFNALVPLVVKRMGVFFSELNANPAGIIATLKEEEDTFLRTLDNGFSPLSFSRSHVAGIARFDKISAGLVKGAVVAGADAFLLYDTYGFPLDLTQIMAEERGLSVDLKGYEDAMAAQRERSRAAGQGGAGVAIVLEAEQTDHLAKAGVLPTDDSFKYDWVSTGAGAAVVASVEAIFDGKNFVNAATPGQVVGVVLNKTSFYAEAGGQVADVGSLSAGDGSSFAVTDVQKFGPFVVHVGSVMAGRITTGVEVTAAVDFARRADIAKNHTATHVLNFALRKVLGGGVDQRGSLVNAEKLRFDFSHNAPVKGDEAKRVEDIVVGVIAAGAKVHRKDVALAEAKRINNLRAVFGEVYPDPVRVVSVGASVEELLANPDAEAWGGLSIEFCGGTHLDDASEAEDFVVVVEEGIAKGIRRIVGVTGKEARAVRANATAVTAELETLAAMAVGGLAEEIVRVSKLIDTTPLPVWFTEAARATLHKLKDKVPPPLCTLTL